MIKSEKKYVEDLIKELKNFFKLKPEEREDAANKLNDNWGPGRKNYAELSDKTENIASTLLVLHHYSEDPKGHDKMIKEVLNDLEKLNF
jgi:hypothetical protein